MDWERVSAFFRTSVEKKPESNPSTSPNSKIQKTSSTVNGRPSIEKTTIVQNDIHFCGYLVKQGGFIKNWKKRFFELKGTTISYYKVDLNTCY
jgi:hypothetical protein